MGLDVSLYKVDDFDKMIKLEKEFDTKSTEIWNEVCGNKKYNEITEEEKNLYFRRTNDLASNLELDKYGSYNKKEGVEIPSEKYSDHYFKIGYFRSAYNETGLNRILRNFISEDLYDIFPHSENEYYIKPDWKSSKEKAEQILKKFSEHTLVKNKVFVTRVSIFGVPEIDSEQEALEIYEKHLKKSCINAFSNKEGYFWIENPISVEAIIPCKGYFNDLCVQVIYKDNEGYDWYVKALEIVIETIDFVLADPEQDKYFLGWSA